MGADFLCNLNNRSAKISETCLPIGRSAGENRCLASRFKALGDEEQIALIYADENKFK